jgi:hypothetical protein
MSKVPKVNLKFDDSPEGLTEIRKPVIAWLWLAPVKGHR